MVGKKHKKCQETETSPENLELSREMEEKRIEAGDKKGFIEYGVYPTPPAAGGFK